MAGTNDVRGALHRRFTTNTVPTLSPIGQQRRQAAGDLQQTNSTRLTPSERAALHYESLLQAQRHIQAELEKVDAETRREVDENRRHEQSVTQLFAQSEPTTPPEYHHAFPSTFSRPNRYSTASLTSPPGIATRPSRASTHLTSPSGGFARAYNNGNHSNLPSQSVPGSRRQSDGEEEDDDFIYGYDDSLRRRSAANPNRNSMPITSYDRKRNTTELVLGPVNTTGFLFDDEDKPAARASTSHKTSPPDTKTFLQVQHTADGFPKLIRREENGELSISAASAALDLASPSPDEPQQLSERPSASRHRISLPPTALSGNLSIAPLNSILAGANENRSAANSRRSMEVHFSAETKRPTLLASPPRGLSNGASMSSYSTNDIPTLKSIHNNDHQDGGVSLASPPTQHSALSNTTSPDQHPNTLPRLHANSARQSQDFSSPAKQDDLQEAFNQSQSALQANAAPFGPTSQDGSQAPSFGSPTMAPFAQSAAYYGGYGMQMMTNGFNQMNIGSANGYGPQAHWPNQVTSQYPQGGYGGYQQFSSGAQAGPGANRFDGSRVSTHQRRQQTEEAQAKFNSIKLEQLVGEIYTLCKDQHGCRFLQRKLEERNEQTVQIIFDEVKNHMVDLMVDPFGNYLCQKLLESTNDEQRTILIQNAKPAMTKIALNQHGTRALQKMIEYITTPEQTALIIEALGNDVVLLIQDLNGNHVIQKCLNHLSSVDATFIFDAVGAHCVTVGTHRHGCCVLQRCIDHADGLQKGKMVDHVIRHAFALVQDPFGNYVVQYILDLSEPCFTEPLCKAFYGEIPALSRQKFSSNVIEKCIRCASTETKRQIIGEIMAPAALDKLLRDGFANYVVQTAMDFAAEDMKPIIMENVRMIVPAIRNTPHGRRIQSKLSDYDNRTNNTTAPSTAMMSPTENVASPMGPTFGAPQQTPAPPRAHRNGIIGAPPQWGTNGGSFTSGGFDSGSYAAGYNGDNIASPTPQRNNQNFGMFNGGQTFQNGYSSAGFSGQGRQPFGHF